MSVHLRPLKNQVIVLTGASSGIGLATARAAAHQGAKLVLVARNHDALQTIAKEIETRGGRAIAVAADVSKLEDIERVADTAIKTFGGFDTWINGAAVSIYGRMDEVPIEDQRRLFDVNYWGVVHGSLVASRYLKRTGGAIINIGSVLSDRTMIWQGAYSASKHAVKGFTDALRMELDQTGAPVSVTLVKPSAIDTPYMEHARTYLDAKGTKNPPPAYDPSVVAKAILYVCENPKRDIVIGAGGGMIPLVSAIFPRTTDKVMAFFMAQTQLSDEPGRPQRRDNLYEPREDGAERSSLRGSSRKTSLYLEAQMRPVLTVSLLAGLGIAALAAVQKRGGAVSRSGNAQHTSSSRFSQQRASSTKVDLLTDEEREEKHLANRVPPPTPLDREPARVDQATL